MGVTALMGGVINRDKASHDASFLTLNDCEISAFTSVVAYMGTCVSHCPILLH